MVVEPFFWGNFWSWEKTFGAIFNIVVSMLIEDFLGEGSSEALRTETTEPLLLLDWPSLSRQVSVALELILKRFKWSGGIRPVLDIIKRFVEYWNQSLTKLVKTFFKFLNDVFCWYYIFGTIKSYNKGPVIFGLLLRYRTVKDHKASLDCFSYKIDYFSN